MDDFVLNVRQIAQYPDVASTGPNDDLLLQVNGLGGPYSSISPANLVATALELGGYIHLAPNNGGIAWNGSAITSDGVNIISTANLLVPSLSSTGDIFVNGEALASQVYVTSLFDDLLLNTVSSFNGRTGVVQLMDTDILRAGGVLQWNPVFAGNVIVPTLWDPRQNDGHAASTAWVQLTICHWLETAPLVQTFNGRSGAVTLTADDVTAAAYLQPGDYIRAPNPALGDVSDRVATCGFVDESLMDLYDTLQSEIVTAISGAYAPINSPAFTGHPTAPTPAPGDNTGNLATTAFVHNAVVAATTGVASFNTRTGAVTLQAADITGAGGALLVSPVFTGNPQAPTLAPGNSSQSLATTAFVSAALAALPPSGVSSFNTRTGAVVLNTADITGAGGATLSSPAFIGTPTAPTAGPGTNTTQIATTAFVAAAVSGSTAGVSSFNTRTGAVTLQANDINAVGGALLNSPNFSGVPTAPTATVGTASTQLATTAFVQNQIGAISSGVASWNTRTGAVTMTASDITTAGGALLASPALTGVPTAPTAAQTSNDGTIATTAYVRAALSSASGGVTSFNTRTGAITLTLADVSAAGGAPINSPSFTGTPTGPTAAPGTASGQLATTQFVLSSISASGGVNTFNGRAGAVVLNATDIQGASGAVYRQSDTAPSATPNTFWFDSLHGQLYVQYVDPVTSALSWVIANSTPAPPITFQANSYPGTAGAGSSGSGATTSATYTTPASSSISTIYRVRQQAAGGGGGGTSASPGYPASAGGGGEFKEYLLTGVAPNTAITLALGTGGQWGNPGASINPGIGGSTTLSFGTTSVVCNGGGGGSNAISTWQYSGRGGMGGTTTQGAATITMLLHVNGGSGTPNDGYQYTPSNGGWSFLGSGSMATTASDPGYTDVAPGYGGGGAGAYGNSAAGWGGGAGIIIIERIAG